MSLKTQTINLLYSARPSQRQLKLYAQNKDPETDLNSAVVSFITALVTFLV